MPKTFITAEDITEAIIQRITTGKYSPGIRLPSVRDLADEIGSNRNTISKAYRMLLEMGVIENNPGGRKGFSVKQTAITGEKTKKELLEYYYQQSVDLIWQGMAAGISAEEMLAQLKDAVGDVYRRSEVRMIFFECNVHDTTEMGEKLNQVLGMKVEYKVLEDLHPKFTQTFKQYDLVITTYHHLAEIREAIKTLGESAAKVVGIDTRPTAETMLKIARLPCTRVGLVCTFGNTAHMLKHILYGYHPEWEINAVAMDDPNLIMDLARSSDHFIVTHTCADEVTQLTGRTPDVVVNFQIDEQSISFIRQRIYEIQMEKMKPLQNITAINKKGSNEH